MELALLTQQELAIATVREIAKRMADDGDFGPEYAKEFEKFLDDAEDMVFTEFTTSNNRSLQQTSAPSHEKSQAILAETVEKM